MPIYNDINLFVGYEPKTTLSRAVFTTIACNTLATAMAAFGLRLCCYAPLPVAEWAPWAPPGGSPGSTKACQILHHTPQDTRTPFNSYTNSSSLFKVTLLKKAYGTFASFISIMGLFSLSWGGMCNLYS